MEGHGRDGQSCEKADYDHGVPYRFTERNREVDPRGIGHPVLSIAGDLEQFVGSSTDITERKAAGARA